MFVCRIEAQMQRGHRVDGFDLVLVALGEQLDGLGLGCSNDYSSSFRPCPATADIFLLARAVAIVFMVWDVYRWLLIDRRDDPDFLPRRCKRLSLAFLPISSQNRYTHDIRNATHIRTHIVQQLRLAVPHREHRIAQCRW